MEAKEPYWSVELDLITGLLFGIAHAAGDDDEDYNWCIFVGLGFVSLSLTSYKG